MAEERSWDDLPEECWELVFDHLNQRHHHHRHLESVSLVNKRFLSISNRLRTSFTITDPTILLHRSVSGLLRRFPQTKRIDFVEFHGDLDQVIREIASSGLNLEALNLSKQKRIPLKSIKELGAKVKNSLKILICSRLHFLEDIDLFEISKAFPYLEELDISYPGQELLPLPGLDSIESSQSFMVTDTGIAALSSNLPQLRRINFSGNEFLSDPSLRSLTSNCTFLREIVVRDCSFISHEEIGSIILRNPNLVSLSVDGVKISPYPTSSGFTIERLTLFGARALNILDFSKMIISDELLFSMGEADLPLQKLVLSHCQGFTFTGISSLLRVTRSLKHLDLEGADFLTNESIMDLSQYFFDLTFINLNWCSDLTSSTFYTLAMNCTHLEEVHMERTNLGVNDLATDLQKSPKVQYLKLAKNKYLDDKTLMNLGFVCPKLRLLDVSCCPTITEQGIHEIRKSCCDIKELEVSWCGRIKNIGTGLEFPKLEVLRAMGSGIDDEGLSMMIGHELLCLDLEACLKVTERGVKEVVENCKGMRELNLKRCYNVSIDILTWMVFTRPSLRKIIPPCGFIPSEKQRELFLRHGCMVYNG